MPLLRRTVLNGTFVLTSWLLAAPAMGAGNFSGNACSIPTPAQLAVAGVTAPCAMATKQIPNKGGVPARTYTAHWGTPPVGEHLLAQQSSYLSIQITKFTGPKTKLARLEKFENEQIAGNLGGGIKLGGNVKIGKEPGRIAKDTELLFLWGHLYVVLIRFDKPPVEGVVEPPEAAKARINELIAFGRSTLAAL